MLWHSQLRFFNRTIQAGTEEYVILYVDEPCRVVSAFVGALRTKRVISKWKFKSIRWNIEVVSYFFGKWWIEINSSFSNFSQFCLIFAIISSIVRFRSKSNRIFPSTAKWEKCIVLMWYMSIRLDCAQVWSKKTKDFWCTPLRDMITISFEAGLNQFYS